MSHSFDPRSLAGGVLTFEDFEALPRLPGWKYEYVDRFVLEPDWHFEVARLPLPAPTRRLFADDVAIAPASSCDEGDLLAALDAAFADTPDYYRVSDRARRHSLACALRRVREHSVDGTSGAAALVERTLVGAALVRLGRTGPVLDVIGVRPEWRGRGVASALLAEATAALDADALLSRYLLANVASAAWHRARGFEILPTSWAVRSRLHAARWEHRNGRGSAAEVAALKAELTRLEAEEPGGTPPPLDWTRPPQRTGDQ